MLLSPCVLLFLRLRRANRNKKHRTELFGSVLFSLSLNFKQMALYYAPAFFFFLLASCALRGGGGACGKETGEFFFFSLERLWGLRGSSASSKKWERERGGGGEGWGVVSRRGKRRKSVEFVPLHSLFFASRSMLVGWRILLRCASSAVP